jgi:hypothetical protein
MTKNISNKKWVVLELNPLCDKLHYLDLIKKISRLLGGKVEVYIPVSTFIRRGEETVIPLVEGYVFVEGSLPEKDYFKLERSPFIDNVLTMDGDNGKRSISYVDESSIQDLRSKAITLTEGEFAKDQVIFIIEGVYRNLYGKIIGEKGPDLEIEIQGLQSIQAVVTIPKAFVRPASEEELESLKMETLSL